MRGKKFESVFSFFYLIFFTSPMFLLMTHIVALQIPFNDNSAHFIDCPVRRRCLTVSFLHCVSFPMTLMCCFSL